ncbi:MAG TPA: hypothetical protein VNG91_03405, partial [Terriglobia bacterium]|nr:hypothetical protein [Terriglobia bacterium]
REARLRGWKTYRNVKFGFEFQYPKKFFVVDYAVGPNEHQFLADQPISGTQPPLLDLVELQTRKGRRVLSIEIPDMKKFPVVHNTYDWSLRACGEVGFEEILSKEQTLFAGYPTLKVLNSLTQFYCINDPRQPVIIFFQADSTSLPARILSTFRFLKECPTP